MYYMNVHKKLMGVFTESNYITLMLTIGKAHWPAYSVYITKTILIDEIF